jgi:hypothetical protein
MTWRRDPASGFASAPGARRGVRRPAWRAVVYALSTLLIGAQGLAALHFVVVSHHFCLDHGSVGHGDAPAAAAPAEAPSERAAVRRGDHDAAGHEHCTFLARLAERSDLTRAGPVLEAPRATAAAGVNEAAEARPQDRTALLLLAPKQSPPA